MSFISCFFIYIYFFSGLCGLFQWSYPRWLKKLWTCASHGAFRPRNLLSIFTLTVCLFGALHFHVEHVFLRANNNVSAECATTKKKSPCSSLWMCISRTSTCQAIISPEHSDPESLSTEALTFLKWDIIEGLNQCSLPPAAAALFHGSSEREARERAEQLTGCHIQTILGEGHTHKFTPTDPSAALSFIANLGKMFGTFPYFFSR